jgi:thioredoxin-dependent peroxiredoxin
MNLERSLPCLLVILLAAVPAAAALKVGDPAPDFQAQASQNGQVTSFSLLAALKHGPVVLYFYPAAFTPGCTAEAHAFADAVDQFKALGASVVGVSHDSIETLNKFSFSECRGKFPVAADTDQAIMKSYDSIMPSNPERANRTSYVITPEGKVFYTFTDLKPDLHVANALAAVKRWKEQAGM